MLGAGDERAADLTSTKVGQWAAEAVPEPFTTTKDMASRPVVAALAHGDTGKRQSCRYAASAEPAAARPPSLLPGPSQLQHKPGHGKCGCQQLLQLGVMQCAGWEVWDGAAPGCVRFSGGSAWDVAGSRGCPVQCLIRSTSLCIGVPVGPESGGQGLQS